MFYEFKADSRTDHFIAEHSEYERAALHEALAISLLSVSSKRKSFLHRGYNRVFVVRGISCHFPFNIYASLPLLFRPHPQSFSLAETSTFFALSQ